jgi:hypothetical protein
LIWQRDWDSSKVEVHNRMQVVLEAHDFEQWECGGVNDARFDETGG